MSDPANQAPQTESRSVAPRPTVHLPGPIHLPAQPRFFFDTEFMEADGHVELLSIGIVAIEHGTLRSMYAVNTDADTSKANDFVREHVLPMLETGFMDGSVQKASLPGIAKLVEDFLYLGQGGRKWTAWAYYADYDWVAFCSLWGRMVDLPKRLPWFCMDIKQLAVHVGAERGDLPPDDPMEHHALVDAFWTYRAYSALREFQQEADA